MKRTALILAALLCMASRHPDRMIRADIALNASFNRGDASDRSIYAATGSLNNGASVTAGNRHVTLDGVNDHISYGDSNAYSFTAAGVDKPFSVSCWVNLSSVTDAYRCAVSKLEITGGQLEWQLLASSNSTFKGPGLALYHADGSKSIQRWKSTLSVSAGTWFHLAATYSAATESGADIDVYINGVVVDDTSSDALPYTGMTNGTAHLRVGTAATTSNPLGGSVDDVRIYSRALTSAEVSALYSEGHP